ncbi:MAG: hypothetical protein SGILL_005744, partial [Bacillariaceae sp.]
EAQRGQVIVLLYLQRRNLLNRAVQNGPSNEHNTILPETKPGNHGFKRNARGW